MAADSNVCCPRVKAGTLTLGLLVLVGCSLSGCACNFSNNGDARDLIWAAARGDAALAKRLIEAGADMNKLDEHGRTTALGVAADSGSLSVAEMLISKGADVNKGCPLYYAAQKGHMRIAEVLLHAGAEPNRFRVGQTPSPILAAARSGYLNAVRLLVAQGSELGVQDGDNSPLIAAAANKYADVVEYLAVKGGNIDVADSDGRTALYMAAADGSLNVVRVLLKHGADPDHKNCTGKTPRLVAEEKGHKTIIEAMEAAQRK